MSRHHASDARDLSASWDSESVSRGESSSASSEEGHLADYRAFVTPLACAPADHRRKKKERKRAAKAESLQQKIGEPTSLACQRCEQGLSCHTCAEARRKQKEKQQQQQQGLSMPMLYERHSSQASQALQGMLRTDAPMPDTIAVSKPLELPKLVSSEATTTTTPIKITLKAPVTTKLDAPLPKLVYCGAARTPLVTAEEKAVASLPTLEYYEKRLPALEARPLSTNLDGARADRLHLQFKLNSQAQSPGMRALLQTPFATPLACQASGESMSAVQCHLRTCHPQQFALLSENGLLDEARDLRAAESDVCFLFVLPVKHVLGRLGEPHSEATQRLLRHHVLKIPEAMTFASIRERVRLPTLAGTDVEVEYRDGALYVGGFLAQVDDFYPEHLAHIQGLLHDDGADDVEETTAASSTAAMDQDDSVSEEELPPPSDAPPDLPEGTQQLVHTQNLIVAVGRDTLLTRASLGRVVAKLSLANYMGVSDLADRQTQLADAAPVTLALRTYDTRALWTQCCQGQLADLSRVKPQRHIQTLYKSTPHFKLEDGTRLSEYAWNGTTVTRAQLADGLCELVFNNPLAPERVTRMQCKLQAGGALLGRATYMTDNEAVMLRFNDVGLLSTILINHEHTMPDAQVEVDEQHFVELLLDANSRARFTAELSKQDFDALLLKESTLSRFTRKAKKFVRNKTRNALSAGNAQKKKQLALKLVTVAKPANLRTLFAEPKGDAQAGKTMNVRVYDHKMKMRDQESQSGLSLVRYSDPVVWYQVTGTNQLYDQLQRTDNYYLELDVDQWRHLTFNAAAVTSQSQLYYADGVNNDVFVLQFDGTGLGAVAKISRLSAFYKQMK